MKKVILFLLLLISVQTFAQIRRTVEFDFTKPTALNPSITPEPENSQTVIVTDNVFKNKGVSISFAPIGTIKIGSRIVTIVHNGVTSYYLRLSSITDMTFAVENGSTLNEISFSDDTVWGGAYLKEGEKGYINPYETYKKWIDNNTDNITSVTLRNTDKDTQFYHIYVTYTEPSAVLSPVAASIPQNGTVESFDKFTLNFADNMSMYSSNGIILSDGTKTWNMAASVSGKTVTLSAPEAIEKDGTYTLTIPAKCFKNADGYENQALTYTFKVVTPKNILNFVSVNPVQGNIDKLSSGIVLKYPTFINVNDVNLVLKYNDTDLVPVKIAKNVDDSKSAVLTFDGIPEGITDKGVYTITIPENTITNLMGEIYNPTFTLKYEIGGTTPTPDPEPDPKPEDSEMMKKAKELVSLSGVGYPTDESDSKMQLKALTEAETVPSDDELKTAIASFYAESNVKMPMTGNWYTIANVDSKGTKRYLVEKDNTISISTNAAEATAFEATENGAFKTIDGKYLYTNGLRDVETSLELKKFALSSVEAEKTFGTLSIKGFFKTNAVGKEFDAYMLVDCANNELKTDETITDLQFEIDNNLSSAFALAETNKPEEEIKTVETAYTITPDVVESGEDLTLTFTGLQNVTMSSDFDAYIANAAGDRIESASVIASTSQTNQFTIALSGYDKGNYQVIFPEGSFLYQKDGKTVQTQLIKKSFTIGKGGSGDDGNFSYTYNQVIALPSVNNVIKDSDLNNFTIGILIDDYSDLVADPSKTVRIAKYNNNQTMATGHFVESSESEPGFKFLKLVLDEPIVEGSFAKDLYAVVIEAGTFGDANFAKYLADKTSVSAKSCKVNPFKTISYNVDNETATGIDEISFDSVKKNVIYDLMGRRVQNMFCLPGIYIVNGKKVVKK